MTYAKGTSILASDYGNLAGVTTSAAASGAAATNKAGYLWGVGYGDRGYGQTAPALTGLSVGAVETGAEWTNLRTTMSNLASWQNTAATLLPPSSAVSAGAAIAAFPAGNSPYAIVDHLALLDTNRLNYQIGNMAVSSSTTSTRGSTWGSGGAATITCEFSVTFPDENGARYFFNTGGEIRLALAHPSTLSSRDTSWNTVLSNLVCAFRAHSSVRLTGSYGTAQAIGYYELTTAYQNILEGTNIGVGVYSVNDFYVQAKALSITGLNGAKGSVLYFKVILTDEYAGVDDTVQSGTNAVLTFLKASTITSPNVSKAVVTAF